MASLRERAIKSEDLGLYWKGESGWSWYQMPIEIGGFGGLGWYVFVISSQPFCKGLSVIRQFARLGVLREDNLVLPQGARRLLTCHKWL